ncbi:MAG: PEP-CTERM sorting domain-containing protein [Pirellulales bacterium]|nr:PEP-CTERM sorting domain-containing protein [Pirellulales bacterium]
MATCALADASVTLDLDDNGVPGTGLHSYTLTATGTGITSLSRFNITGDVHQVFGAGGEQSEWLGVGGGASVSETTDSYVIFGTLRLPDLGGAAWDYETYPEGPPDKVTLETITGGGTVGLGTLNNSDAGPAFNDIYMKVGPPSTVEETVDLMQIVIQDGEGFSINLKLLTASGPNPEDVTEHDNLIYTLDELMDGDTNGDGNVDVVDLGQLAAHYGMSSGATWADADFNHDGAVDVVDLGTLAAHYGTTSASAVPEPSALTLLVLGALTLLWRRRK